MTDVKALAGQVHIVRQAGSMHFVMRRISSVETEVPWLYRRRRGQSEQESHRAGRGLNDQPRPRPTIERVQLRSRAGDE